MWVTFAELLHLFLELRHFAELGLPELSSELSAWDLNHFLAPWATAAAAAAGASSRHVMSQGLWRVSQGLIRMSFGEFSPRIEHYMVNLQR